MKKKLLISFSGGRTSAYMTFRLLKDYADQYEMIAVFANTGKEREETLNFIKSCDDIFSFGTIWLEAVVNYGHRKGTSSKVVNYETASRNGEPYEAVIKKYGIPNIQTSHCTRELKLQTIRHYARSIGWKDYHTAVGIRNDEVDRVSVQYKKNRILYPLINLFPTTKKDVIIFWHKQPFDLNLKEHQGNCDCCFKKSFSKLITIAKDEPKLFDWWQQMESMYSHIIPTPKKRLTAEQNVFFRGKRKVKDIFDMISNDLPSSQLELSNGCSESCEVF